MKRMIRRKEKSVVWPTNLPSIVFLKIKKLSKIVRKLIVVKSSEVEFKVIDYKLKGSVHFVMDLSKGCCDCLG